MEHNKTGIKQMYSNYSSHILLVLITIMIMSFIYRGALDSNFINSISLGSTITSIILSIIAIFYTFLDSKNSESITLKMIDSTNNISQSVSSINESSEKLSNKIKSLDQIDRIMQQLDQLVINSEKTLDKLKSDEILKEIGGDTMDNSTSTNVDFNFNKDNLIAFLGNLSINIRSCCFFIYKAYDENSPLSYDQYNDFFNEMLVNDDLPGYDINQDIYTTLTILKALNLVDIESNDKYVLKVAFFNHDFEEALLGFIPKEHMMGDAPQARFYGTVYNYFNKIKNLQ